MMDKRQLRNLIRRVLIGIGLYSEEAENLLMGTAAQESALGVYIRQLGNGPALGIFQMEPATFDDIVGNHLHYHPELCKKIRVVAGVSGLNSELLEYNLALAIGMARVHYARVREVIPGSLSGWAYYWKRYYNTLAGKGTEEEFVYNYKRYVL